VSGSSLIATELAYRNTNKKGMGGGHSGDEKKGTRLLISYFVILNKAKNLMLTGKNEVSGQ
jgi:hypothetical protein